MDGLETRSAIDVSIESATIGGPYLKLKLEFQMFVKEPVPGYRVAIIQDGDMPVELVQTSLSDDALWERAETESILYQGPCAASAVAPCRRAASAKGAPI